jgi:hypothetical protein
MQINDFTQEFLNNLLKDVKNQYSYYAGGTLCIDFQKYTIMFNLNETCSVSNIETGESQKRLMSIENCILVFRIYQSIKGDTEYFMENFRKSFVSKLVEFDLLIKLLFPNAKNRQ